MYFCFFFYSYGDHRYLNVLTHSFPTRRSSDLAEASASEVKLGNPLDFGPALLLAGLVAVMAIPARWALEQFGDQGIIVVLGLTGMWDVDAAVLTLAGMPKDILDGTTAGLVLAVPVLANTALKGVLALGIAGPRQQGWKASAPLFASVDRKSTRLN